MHSYPRHISNGLHNGYHNNMHQTSLLVNNLSHPQNQKDEDILQKPLTVLVAATITRFHDVPWWSLFSTWVTRADVVCWPGGSGTEPRWWRHADLAVTRGRGSGLQQSAAQTSPPQVLCGTAGSPGWPAARHAACGQDNVNAWFQIPRATADQLAQFGEEKAAFCMQHT